MLILWYQDRVLVKKIKQRREKVKGKFKKISMLFIIATIMCMMVGCEKYVSYTYNVDTGDTIKVELNMRDSYELTPNVPFVVEKDGEECVKGTFIYVSYYYDFVESLEYDDDMILIDEGTKDGNDYVFVEYLGDYMYVICVDDSNTGVALEGYVDKDEMELIFDRLTFSLEN